MNNLKLLKNLHAKYDQLQDEARSLKTKKAQQKRYKLMHKTELLAGDVLHRLLPPKTKLILRDNMNCSGIIGGGYGINKGSEVEIDHAGSSIVFFCSGEVFKIDYIFTKGWSKNSIYKLVECA